jgi:hypothetical protein
LNSSFEIIFNASRARHPAGMCSLAHHVEFQRLIHGVFVDEAFGVELMEHDVYLGFVIAASRPTRGPVFPFAFEKTERGPGVILSRREPHFAISH